MAADPVLKYMTRADMEQAIERLKTDMMDAARRMDFLQAAQFRDEIVRLQNLVQEKD